MTSVPEIWIDLTVQDNQRRGVADSPQLRQSLRQEYATRQALAQQAKQLGLDKKPDIQARLAMAEQELLTNALAQDFAQKNPVSDAEMRAEYQRQSEALSKAGASTEFHVQQIVVRDKAMAQSLFDQVQKGAPMEPLATQYSIDPSRARGGDNGWLLDVNLVPAVRDAVSKAKDGALVSELIQTQAGWHIIRRKASRAWVMPAMDQSRPALAAAVARAKWAAYVRGLVPDAQAVPSAVQ